METLLVVFYVITGLAFVTTVGGFVVSVLNVRHSDVWARVMIIGGVVLAICVVGLGAGS